MEKGREGQRGEGRWRWRDEGSCKRMKRQSLECHSLESDPSMSSFNVLLPASSSFCLFVLLPSVLFPGWHRERRKEKNPNCFPRMTESLPLAKTHMAN
jgi:hypothetical protein